MRSKLTEDVFGRQLSERRGRKRGNPSRASSSFSLEVRERSAGGFEHLTAWLATDLVSFWTLEYGSIEKLLEEREKGNEFARRRLGKLARIRLTGIQLTSLRAVDPASILKVNFQLREGRRGLPELVGSVLPWCVMRKERKAWFEDGSLREGSDVLQLEMSMSLSTPQGVRQQAA